MIWYYPDFNNISKALGKFFLLLLLLLLFFLHKSIGADRKFIDGGQ